MTCKLNEDSGEDGGDHTEGPPPKHTVLPLKKDLRYLKGVGRRTKKEGGKSFNLFLKKRK